MIIRIYLSLFFLLACITALSQSASVKGVICEMGNPVDLGHVYLKHSLKGTVTNESGSFELFYSVTEDGGDTLVVSCLGYETRYLALKGLATDTLHRFEMVRLPYELGEVVVLPPGLTPLGILKNALRNRRKNLPNNPYYLEGFCRFTGHIENQYARVVEAAIGAKVHGQWFDKEKDDLALFEARSSNDFMQEKSFFMMAFEKALSYASGRKTVNELYSIFHLMEIEDLIVGSGGVKWDKSFEFSIDRVIVNEDMSKTYVVKFNRANVATVRGMYYINSKSWAIERYESEWINNGSKYKYPYNRSHFQKVHYQQIDGEMYPVMIQTKGFGKNAIHNTEVEGEQTRQFNTVTLLVNYVDPKFRKHRKDFKAHLLPREEYFDASKYPYHPEFWKTYNLLQLNPQDKKVIEDLSKNMPLEQQFIKNGKQ
jgi:hypothetical protein